MNKILQAILQIQYNLNCKESTEIIKEAKMQGRILDLYKTAMTEIVTEMNENV